MFCLDELVTSKAMPLPPNILLKFDEVYGFSHSKNVEISNRFLVICLRCHYRQVLPMVDDFLSKHGRGRYIKPLYNYLNELDHNVAVEIWKKHRHRYHSVMRNIFDPKLLK